MIVNNTARQFDNDAFRCFYIQLSMKYFYYSLAYPQANEHVVVNKIIMRENQARRP